MNNATQAYAQLVKSMREIKTLDSVGALLSWDEQVLMPPKGAETRAAQASLVARLSHEQFTSPQIGELLQAVESSDLVRDPHDDPAANARKIRRLYDRARKIPATLVEEISRCTVLAQQAWTEARKKSDFPAFAPWLKQMVELTRQLANCIGYTGHIYNALLDYYEPGETAENLQKVFDALRPQLVEIVGRIAQSPRKAPVEILHRHYPKAAQEQLARQASEMIGFDFSAGRLDTSVHPFCSGHGPGDCRLTNRYDEHDFSNAFFGVMHETGHGLYDQGLPAEHFGTPLGEAISLGIHESQSRLWENLVGRGRPFWQFLFPRVKGLFPDALGDVSLDQWLFAVNAVQPSFIRTEADQATYNLHVLLRFDLEQALLAGEFSINDVPAAWNERMRQYLGLTPPDDARGCLQDIHWSAGLIGYFPTYTLGNLYAAQFFDQAHKDLPDLDQQLSSGQFAGLLAWLRQNIHRHGQRYRASELVQKVTGQALSARPLLRHLKTIAAEMYGV